MPSQGTSVFVSYSHADASLVAPVVKLLRVNKSFVFQDIDRIQPGKKWRSEIAKALTEAQLVVVFWCGHASRSNEVSKEWKAAIEQEKDLLPLLLDATPLPPELGEFQWIDFRGTVGANHSSIESSYPTSKPQAMKSKWLFLSGLAAVVVSAVGGSLLTLKNLESSSSSKVPIDILPLPPFMNDAPNSSILLIVSVVLAATSCVAWFLRRRSKRGAVIKRASSLPGEIERRIAIEIEAEILRRTTSRQDAET